MNKLSSAFLVLCLMSSGSPAFADAMDKSAMEKGSMEKGSMEKGSMEKGSMEKGAMTRKKHPKKMHRQGGEQGGSMSMERAK